MKKEEDQGMLSFMDLISCALGGIILLFFLFSTIFSNQLVRVKSTVLILEMDSMGGNQETFPDIIISYNDKEYLVLKKGNVESKKQAANPGKKVKHQTEWMMSNNRYLIVSRLELPVDRAFWVRVRPKVRPQKTNWFNAKIEKLRAQGIDPRATRSQTVSLIELDNRLLDFLKVWQNSGAASPDLGKKILTQAIKLCDLQVAPAQEDFLTCLEQTYGLLEEFHPDLNPEAFAIEKSRFFYLMKYALLYMREQNTEKAIRQSLDQKIQNIEKSLARKFLRELQNSRMRYVPAIFYHYLNSKQKEMGQCETVYQHYQKDLADLKELEKRNLVSCELLARHYSRKKLARIEQEVKKLPPAPGETETLYKILSAQSQKEREPLLAGFNYTDADFLYLLNSMIEDQYMLKINILWGSKQVEKTESLTAAMPKQGIKILFNPKDFKEPKEVK